MPRCLGGFENGIHISKVDMIIEGSNSPIAEMGGGAAATEVDHAVARQIVAADSRRCLPSAWNRRYAKRCRLTDC